MSPIFAEKNNVKINTTFKIIGEAAATANLLFEFRIAAKKEANETNNKKGKVILVRFTANEIFSLSSTNPGANKDTKVGIKISIIIVKIKSINNNKLKILLANLSAFNLPNFCSAV